MLALRIVYTIVNFDYFDFSSHSSEQYLASGLVTNLPHCEHVEYMTVIRYDHKKAYFDRIL